MTRPRLSYEVFPPADASGTAALRDTITSLNGRGFEFVSVTYGAGGGQRDRSFAAIDMVATLADCPVAAHLTCVGVSRSDAESVIDTYIDLGVRHIVALRGDPPTGIDQPYVAHPDGFASTAELVAAIGDRARARHADISVTVSAYPEVHPQSPSLDHDLDVLEAKVAAGATQAISQMFFVPERFRDYISAIRARGCGIDVVAGIMPLHPAERIAGFAQRCGAHVPPQLLERITHSDDPRSTAIDVAVEQIHALQQHGSTRFHLYTLNRPGIVRTITERLDLS